MRAAAPTQGFSDSRFRACRGLALLTQLVRDLLLASRSDGAVMLSYRCGRGRFRVVRGLARRFWLPSMVPPYALPQHPLGSFAWKPHAPCHGGPQNQPTHHFWARLLFQMHANDSLTKPEVARCRGSRAAAAQLGGQRISPSFACIAPQPVHLEFAEIA